ncbi:VOC family protein [Nocardioides piscis]|uniref:VOC family protein n=1 Tax=Nocardioides piscis TaxID=2714938 RepID=A0A6G7YDZ2_9ACTN|nr:VOC family protein [Nocardioides piscis]QIK74827.1 VOC family protein [Nocardioides piscis]
MAKFDRYDQGTPSWIEHTSADPQASKEFYGQVFGWDFEESTMTGDDGQDLGSYSIAKLGDDRVAGLGPVMDGAQPSSWGVYLAADDVDDAVAKAQQAGGQVLAEPMDVPDQGRMAWVADPTGAPVGLWQDKGFAGCQRANEHATLIWNELETPDLDRAAPFYGAVLGLTTETIEMPGSPEPYVMLNANGRSVAGLTPPPAPDVPAHWNVSFNVDDVDAAVAHASELGATTITPAFDVEGVGRLAVLQDPQGASFVLMQNPPDGAQG